MGTELADAVTSRSSVLDLRETAKTAPEPWVPADGVLLHIGPHKTGTTALQSALIAARHELREQGILYPGKRRHQAAAKSAMHAGSNASQLGTGEESEWQNLVAQVRAGQGKTLISSEKFCSASDSVAEHIVQDLGGDNVRVLVTLRPLERILPSSWQEGIKHGGTESLEDWLAENLDGTYSQRLWHGQRHDRLVKRWAEAAGPEHVAVLPVSASNPELLLREFEFLVGISPGLLQASLANRSLTSAEVDLIRELNVRLDLQGVDLKGADKDLYMKLLFRGAFQGLVEGRGPYPGEQRVEMPAWAVARSREIQLEMLQNILNSGVEVVGDLNQLVPRGDSTMFGKPGVGGLPEVIQGSGAVPSVPNEVAAEMIAGIFERARHLGRELGPEGVRLQSCAANSPVGVSAVPASTLVEELARRGKRRARLVLKRGRQRSSEAWQGLRS